MRAKVVTLRFSPTLGRFDDAALVSLQQKVVLEHLREHLVQVGDEAMLLCVATWREKVAAAESPPAAVEVTQPATTATRDPARPVGDLRAELDADQQQLFDLLRQWRSKKAHDEGVPPYVILTNRQLVEVVRHRPPSKARLAEIDGLGDKKIGRHGTEILAMLWPDLPQPEEPDVAPAVAEVVAEATP